MLVYVNETIDAFIATHYGEISPKMRNEISNTFELYWDKYGYRYAEVKTLKKYLPTPPLNFLEHLNTKK
jgi:hypothetical protein